MSLPASQQETPWRLSRKQQQKLLHKKRPSNESVETLPTENDDHSDSYDDDASYSSYSTDMSSCSSSSHESDMDDLEQEMLCFDLQRQRRRHTTNGSLSALLANSDHPKKKPARRATMTITIINQRMEAAQKNNSYLQDPKKPVTKPIDDQALRPDQFLQKALATDYTSESTFRSDTWEQYFTAVTPERIEAHSLVVASAIRKGDLAKLRKLVAKGHRLDGCNKQGESSMHLACRLGRLDVVQFLLEQGNVNVRVRDDCGRTPLHDACWTNQPNFELVYCILEQAPELLFLEDHRGFTALHYVPGCVGKQWCKWIEQHKTWLQSKVHHSTWLKANDDLDQAQMRMKRLMERTEAFGM